jgi:nucleoside-diphosphate-sugar epimerase
MLPIENVAAVSNGRSRRGPPDGDSRKKMRRILVTRALGQIGSELVSALRARSGTDRIIASDLRTVPPLAPAAQGPYEHVDCVEPYQILEAVRRHDVGTIYHLAALLSAVAEEKPQVAWSVNMGGL